MIATDEFVVAHATIGQGHSSPRPDPNLRTQREARSKHQSVKQVALESYVLWHRAIVVWAWQRRDEVHVAGRPAFEKAAPRDLDHHVELWHSRPCLAATGSAVGIVVHCERLHRGDPATALPGSIVPLPSRPSGMD